MSNVAVLSTLNREISAISDGIGRVADRAHTPWAARNLRAAQASLAEAQLHLVIAAHGIDAPIEVQA